MRDGATMAGVDSTCVTIDCRSPDTLAEFWNEALRWGGTAVAADGSGAICGPATVVHGRRLDGGRRVSDENGRKSYWNQPIRIVPAVIVTLVAVVILMLIVL